jgi:hypothetical protein
MWLLRISEVFESFSTESRKFLPCFRLYPVDVEFFRKLKVVFKNSGVLNVKYGGQRFRI